ncbi:hypothetical protein Anas_09583 [Armadillidium nasatum]|uniref:Uncharacterized protein n=1 Tax=Armadillidium nasatum TaxID=96803 RepID=A0A5N5STV5_9CRUS|nr:hypothetical protein Anas_09583 [Armadillidium nasatum]
MIGANKILCMHLNQDTFYQKGCMVDMNKDYITPDNLHAYILIILSYALIYLNENIAIVLSSINGCFH